MNTTSRRHLLVTAVAAGASVPLAPAHAVASSLNDASRLAKPRLPFAADALAPFISEDTVRTHFAAHHQGFYSRLSALLPPSMANASLVDIIKASHGDAALSAIHDAAGELFNHNVYWSSLRSPGGDEPRGPLLAALQRDFGGRAGAERALTAAAASHFASGWVWLVRTRSGALAVTTTGNGNSPLTMGASLLLGIDVWEHAYYLDRKHRRTEYLAAVVGNLLNWEFAQANFEA